MTEERKEPSDNKIISILKIDNQGWDINMFENKMIALTWLCARCENVCVEAVELGCPHHENDVYLFCNECLTIKIDNNDKKCPINLHNNPNVTPCRAVRRQISNSLVICPYSAKYHSIQQNDENCHHNPQFIDTLGNYEQEHNCDWDGTLTLSDLINKHIISCHKKNNAKLNMKIKSLQNEQQKLQRIINNLKENVILLDDEKKNDENCMKFIVPDKNKNYFSLQNNSKCIIFHCGWGAGPGIYCQFGKYWERNDKITVSFDVSKKGKRSNYEFGFASVNCKNWNKWPLKHAITIDGEGKTVLSDEFIVGNEKL
eukprot:492640_1